MMRANSHDSIVADSEGTCTVGPPTQVVTPNEEVLVQFPKLEASPSPLTPLPATVQERDGQNIAISTPPIHIVGSNSKTTVDVQETPRPAPSLEQNAQEDEDPTPRPPARTIERDPVSPFPGSI
ncbi:hypothetical protein QBC42DRAFT_273448 [Cladorrhinum samala]|uniref:Uncharacterized protein n=1 Tax=Cladorrhinum samala TaxID=585594 RepID=A0AAV9HGV7_9PEZI|nr:hypothetical protein QBC42DRAFT_273448 [Cladorrhinum samala]